MTENFGRLKNKPWEHDRSDIPPEIFLPRGMLGDEERRCLWWLGRHYATGSSAVVDAGSYIGASAFCLASGLASNPQSLENTPIVTSFDFFEAFDEYVASHISSTLRPCNVGESYLDIYKWQTGKYGQIVEPVPGDFTKQKWSGQKIDICFIDIAKTQSLTSHSLTQFLPCMVPNHSLLIQQDFYHCWHPHMQIAMQYLKDHFVTIDRRIQWQSRLYGMLEMPDIKQLQKIHNWSFTDAEELDLLDQYISSESGDDRGMAHVVKLYHLFMKGNVSEYEASEKRFLEEFDPARSTELWAEQYIQVKGHFNSATNRV